MLSSKPGFFSFTLKQDIIHIFKIFIPYHPRDGILLLEPADSLRFKQPCED